MPGPDLENGESQTSVVSTDLCSSIQIGPPPPTPDRHTLALILKNTSGVGKDPGHIQSQKLWQTTLEVHFSNGLGYDPVTVTQQGALAHLPHWNRASHTDVIR